LPEPSAFSSEEVAVYSPVIFSVQRRVVVVVKMNVVGEGSEKMGTLLFQGKRCVRLRYETFAWADIEVYNTYSSLQACFSS